MLTRHRIAGTWLGDQSRVVLTDYRAGLLFALSERGEETHGPPESFRSADGESGPGVLERILRPPTVGTFRYGVIRESLAFAYSVALHGFRETRAWDGPEDYVIDTGEGSCGVVRFTASGCVCAMINYDPWRKYDIAEAIRRAPSALQPAATEVCQLPLLSSPHQLRISSLFWGEEGRLASHEPWPLVYKFGGELLRREMLDDESWCVEAEAYYEIPEPSLALFMSTATYRLASPNAVTLTEAQLRALVPRNAPYRAEADDLLRAAGFQWFETP